ncbi:MAG TPA: hypothetical protein IGS40_26460 [Trichormus sp. M33_DOE_039]|nr:hypothetical protein [Trichormus sp. M33_DOE_039]
MEKERLKQEFYARLYQWSVKDAEREASNHFPFLKIMNDLSVNHTLEVLSLFPENIQVKIFVALTKNSYKLSGELSDIDLTLEEKFLLYRFHQKKRMFPHYKSKLHEVFYINKNFLRLSVKKLREMVITELNPILGKAEQEKNHICYRTITENRFAMSTLVSLDSAGLSYSHMLGLLPDGVNLLTKEDFYKKRIVFSNPISVHRWLGFKGGAWFFLEEADAALAAKVIGLACSHFLNALPNLVNDLKVV